MSITQWTTQATLVYAMSTDYNELDYLRVDAWLMDVVSVRALATAIERGLIDRLATETLLPQAVVLAMGAAEPRAAEFLLRLLLDAHVLEASGDLLGLSDTFRHTWKYRDLLMAKLDMALAVSGDWFERFGLLLDDERGFAVKSRLFEIFDYGKALSTRPEDLAATGRWLRYTTALTRYETPAVLARHDFAGYQNMLDIGGNSGEFVLQLCRRHAGLRAVVLDLPAVCALGAVHVGRCPEGARIRFEPVTSAQATWPGGFDLVSFKSMLHDWPQEAMAVFFAPGACRATARWPCAHCRACASGCRGGGSAHFRQSAAGIVLSFLQRNR
ncbi:methyltransferase [Quatrionicoccus australiensis]|uniref:methyltransferase n=1 Tax=Quatrionicoccus australiensis TaxID=138118 RepID=UPI001CF8D354|nr:methyltransferase [Quatrionicoccus australiensis]UCV14042.1 hypothetical protein KI612_13925 [Quatrionicoccus australiensis]